MSASGNPFAHYAEGVSALTVLIGHHGLILNRKDLL